jgi:hypothetical protein
MYLDISHEDAYPSAYLDESHWLLSRSLTLVPETLERKEAPDVDVDFYTDFYDSWFAIVKPYSQ